MNESIETLLAGREERYGSFEGHAEIAQELKATIRKFAELRCCPLDPDQDEALEMIAHKVARVLNGDPDYSDNWIDIAGYATLVAQRLDRRSPEQLKAMERVKAYERSMVKA